LKKMHACSVARSLAQHSSSCGAGQVVASIPDQSTHMDLWPVEMPMQVNGVFLGALKLCSYTTCMYVTEILCRYFYWTVKLAGHFLCMCIYECVNVQVMWEVKCNI
jgi:hypothetical protein